jgi:hypothetical protein
MAPPPSIEDLVAETRQTYKGPLVVCMSAPLPVKINVLHNQQHNNGFQPGHPRYGGRRKGSRGIGGDLRQMIFDAATAAGYLKIDEKGDRVATGEGGAARAG